MEIRSGQKQAWENKVAKGFNTTDVPLEFCLLQGEIAEAFDAWRKGHPDLGEELADVAIYLLSLAEQHQAIISRSRPRPERAHRHTPPPPAFRAPRHRSCRRRAVRSA